MDRVSGGLDKLIAFLQEGGGSLKVKMWLDGNERQDGIKANAKTLFNRRQAMPMAKFQCSM